MGAALCLALALSACSPLVLVNALAPEDGTRRETGIAYGPEPRHKLDVYRPETAGGPAKPVIVFLYGGAWKRGERSQYRFVGETFARHGFTVVVPDYRLYPEVRFPRFVEDAAAAVAWVRDAIAPYGGDPERIVLAGHSAGAHIAALLALDRRYLEAAGVPARAVSGLVGLAGPYAFDPLAYRGTRQIFETAARPDDARPISFARAGAPPMLLLHGSTDRTVLPRNSRALAERLGAAGADARYRPLEGVGHSLILLALSEPFRSRAPVVEAILGFIDGLGPAASLSGRESARR